jgi:hypothetical protein
VSSTVFFTVPLGLAALVGLAGSVMTGVGTAVILALIIVLMLKTRVARASVVIVCVLFGLVLGASPIGDGVNAALAVLGGWASDRIAEL